MLRPPMKDLGTRIRPTRGIVEGSGIETIVLDGILGGALVPERRTLVQWGLTGDADTYGSGYGSSDTQTWIMYLWRVVS